MKARLIVVAVTMFAVTVLAGCSDVEDEESVKVQLNDRAKDFRAKVEPLPEPKPEPKVHFVGTGRDRQPFDSARLGAGRD